MSSKGRLDVRFVTAAGCGLAAFIVGAASVASGGLQLQPKAGAPLQGLSAAELALFEAGKGLFETPLTDEQGLGPIFNKAGCFSCHTNPLGGWGSITVTRFGFSDKGTFDPLTHLGGPLHQAAAINQGCEESIPGPEIANVITLRVTNSSLAFGMIEAIPDAAILANEDPFDADKDGVRGRAHMVHAVEDCLQTPEGPDCTDVPLRVGRFGWKAQVATVLTFSADAAVNEMGLTNRFFPVENAPNGDLALLALCDNVPDPEDVADQDGFDFVDRVTHFQRYLGVPPQTPRSGMSGEAIFNAIGCAVCHVAEWTTADDPSLEDAIRNKTIRPYSNFLLHNMGLLGDGMVDGDAGDLDIRTPTLWNLATRDPMLHDGRAAGGTFFDRVAGPGGAIWWHNVIGSEAQGSASAFFALPFFEQVEVVKFLQSLGRLEFDSDRDNEIDYFDFLDFKACFDFGGDKISPDDECAVHDINQDGVVDLIDFQWFLLAYEGVNGDCNDNGVSDLEEILLGAPDDDGDGIPDDCAAVCVGDIDGSGSIDGADLGALLGAWGTANAGADLNRDGTVDGADLGILLGAWGSCP
ncbi:MAG TPA: di-heme oxidoredictase family protein [Phycisphaerales bacterium]|nr:di-heme oxidoredictase family protein [Phycisphaerales bacterium]HMP36977.1 di-heme oxidoredictase family protein [Phycisphaerales bacterium]